MSNLPPELKSMEGAMEMILGPVRSTKPEPHEVHNRNVTIDALQRINRQLESDRAQLLEFTRTVRALRDIDQASAAKFLADEVLRSLGEAP